MIVTMMIAKPQLLTQPCTQFSTENSGCASGVVKP